MATMQRVRNVARNYHSFGTYHFIMGRQIRTPPHRRISSAGLPPIGEQQEGCFVGGVGDKAYAEEVTSQLDSSKILRTFFVGSGRQASPFAQIIVVSPACGHLLKEKLPIGAYGRNLQAAAWP